MSIGRKIVVMLGGTSAEREVSLKSGAAVAGALRGLGHDVTELDPMDDNWSLPVGTEVVFLALHGTYGEDGTVQRHLESLGVRYTGCGPEASRIAFDKVLTKEACVAKNIPTARYLVLDRSSVPWPAGWEPPVVLKPVCQGSSVGLEFVNQRGEWAGALSRSLLHDTRVLVEERIAGREVTVGILAGRALTLVEVRPKEGAYDYHNKYTKGATEYLCPAPMDATVTARVQEVALGAFRAIGGRDYARVDVMVTRAGDPVVLEVNTLPGMTETSLLPKAAAAEGMDYAALCQKMVDLALAR